MRLRLVQLPAYPAYRVAAAVQELLRRQFLRSKAAGAKYDPPQPVQPPPPPTVIAFTPPPTYTLGRRQSLAQLTDVDRHRLQAPLKLLDHHDHTYTPAIVPSTRGGLTTYHGPGQAVLWPVMDLKTPDFLNYNSLSPLTVRAYSRLLETTTQDVLRQRYGLAAYTTDEPGLWIQSAFAEGGEERKIAALGVHLRRNVSALGVAVNLDTPVTRAPAVNSADSPTNPWERFVPCGIASKGVSSVADEGRLLLLCGSGGGHVPPVPPVPSWDLSPASFARAWAAALAQRLGLADGEVDVADAATVQQLMGEAEELDADMADESKCHDSN